MEPSGVGSSPGLPARCAITRTPYSAFVENIMRRQSYLGSRKSKTRPLARSRASGPAAATRASHATGGGAGGNRKRVAWRGLRRAGQPRPHVPPTPQVAGREDGEDGSLGAVSGERASRGHTCLPRHRWRGGRKSKTRRLARSQASGPAAATRASHATGGGTGGRRRRVAWRGLRRAGQPRPHVPPTPQVAGREEIEN